APGRGVRGARRVDPPAYEGGDPRPPGRKGARRGRPGRGRDRGRSARGRPGDAHRGRPSGDGTDLHGGRTAPEVLPDAGAATRSRASPRRARPGGASELRTCVPRDATSRPYLTDASLAVVRTSF